MQTAKAGYKRSRKQIMQVAKDATHDYGLLESEKEYQMDGFVDL